MITKTRHFAGAIGMKRLLAGAAIFSIVMSGPAQAEITITQGEYEAGVLVVRGETSQPNQRVTLDRRYTERTNEHSQFMFRIPYLPKDCVVNITAGQETRVAYIANCEPAAATGLPKPDAARSASTTGTGTLSAGGLRIVRQPCERGKECRVLCREDEVAVNAFCPNGDAKLVGERAVTCGSHAATRIVAYCMMALAE